MKEQKNFKLRRVCHMCKNGDFLHILDLGEMPPANSFLKKSEIKKEQKFPLAVHLCRNCKSLQLKHVVTPDLLFKNYHYSTGASKPLTEHFNNLADEIVSKYLNSKDDLVVEIGSNDGSLLSRISGRHKVLGVDPARNIAQIAIKRGVPTKVGFFNYDFAKEIRPKVGEAKVIVANNVLAHIDNLYDVFKGARYLLHGDGKFIFEVHWVGNLLTDGGFDQIYHEHLYYHSLNSLKVLVESLGMYIQDINLVPIHGESLRVSCGKFPQKSKSVSDFLKKEIDLGLTKEKTYLNFSKKVESSKGLLSKMLNDLKSAGKKIVGYGAPAKGNTLLNYFSIDSSILDYITDTTISKQGKYTPGTHIKVVSPDLLKKDKPDYVLLLSWNYADSILEKEKALRQSGVKFILPVPSARIV